MAKLIVFNNISLDGYFTDADGEMRWAYSSVQDSEWDIFVASNASGGGTLVFGRVTYEMMQSFWPTPQAMQAYPALAERMNKYSKIVFSRTLTEATWNNTRLINDDLIEEVRELKKSPDNHMAILGSGSIVSQLAEARLIDEFQFVMTPVVLGAGRTLFEGIKGHLPLKLKSTRVFKNGNAVLFYAPG